MEGMKLFSRCHVLDGVPGMIAHMQLRNGGGPSPTNIFLEEILIAPHGVNDMAVQVLGLTAALAYPITEGPGGGAGSAKGGSCENDAQGNGIRSNLGAIRYTLSPTAVEGGLRAGRWLGLNEVWRVTGLRGAIIGPDTGMFFRIGPSVTVMGTFSWWEPWPWPPSP